MLRRSRSQSESSCKLRAIPPIHLHDLLDPQTAQPSSISQSRVERRAMRLPQLAQRREVHVVVVIVTQQHAIDPWQLLESDSRRSHPLRSSPRNRTRALRPDRIRQEVHAKALNQECRMVDEGDSQLIRPISNRRNCGQGPRPVLRAELFGPSTALPTRNPLEQRGEPMNPRREVVKALTVEMIRDTVSIGHFVLKCKG